MLTIGRHRCRLITVVRTLVTVVSLRPVLRSCMLLALSNSMVWAGTFPWPLLVVSLSVLVTPVLLILLRSLFRNVFLTVVTIIGKLLTSFPVTIMLLLVRGIMFRCDSYGDTTCRNGLSNL